jgi:hypothetical protein
MIPIFVIPNMELTSATKSFVLAGGWRRVCFSFLSQKEALLWLWNAEGDYCALIMTGYLGMAILHILAFDGRRQVHA